MDKEIGSETSANIIASHEEAKTSAQPQASSVPKAVKASGTVSPEEMSEFYRRAQIDPPDKVTVPGTGLTLQQLHEQRAAHERKLSQASVKDAQAGIVRETSSILTNSEVTVTPEGHVLASPLSPDTPGANPKVVPGNSPE